MAKKRKKRKSFVPESEAKDALKKSFSEFNWKLLGKLGINFVIIYGLFLFGLKMAEIYRLEFLVKVIYIVYISATTVLASVFIFMNRGISNDVPTKEQLRDDWSDEKKEEFIKDLIQSRKKAKKLLLILIPLIFTLLFDTVYLFFLVK